MRYVPYLLATAAIFASAPALAQDQAAPAADAAASPEIVVFGAGQTRQVQEISNADITILASGSSPLKAIEKLPSVNFQSADAFGNYEWSTRITIRGFNQNQLGFTLDGIPLGDMTYGNHNGLHISRAIIPENIGGTTVSQGSGSIDTQSTNNLGGTLQFTSMDPAVMLGSANQALDVSATAGSDNSYRGFVRAAIGKADAARIMGSFVYGTTDKWKGDGEQRQWAVNAKAIVPVGDVDFDGFFSHSDRAEQDYQDLSLDMIKRLGLNWDNLGPNKYALAVQIAEVGANRGDTLTALNTTPFNPAAGTTYPSPVASADDAYYDASGLRRDTLGAIGVTAPFGGAFTLKLKAYHHRNDGQGTWGTPYVASPSGVNMALRTSEYTLRRSGLFGSIAADLGMNQITVGGWYENNDFTVARRYYGYKSRTEAGRDHLKFQHNPFFTEWEMDFNTKTYQYYVEDTIDLGVAKVNLGWKGFNVDVTADPVVNLTSRASGKLRTRDWFQPHAGISGKIVGDVEAFAGFTQVTRAFVGSTFSGPFQTTQAGFDAIKGKLKPEQSDTYEVGLRSNNSRLNAVLAGYWVNFRNRLLSIPTSVNIVGSPSAVQNVGNVRALGVEAAVDYKATDAITLFASYSYNDTTYRNDVTTGTGKTYATNGKTVVDAPRHLLRGEVSYDDKALFGRIGVNYMSKRYFTYTNDQSVPGRAIVDAALGYRFDMGMRQPVELQVNATNLFDKGYIATIGSGGFGFSGDNMTLLAGAPRQVFVTLKAGF
ncbi:MULTISPECIES: TonB-dependent receptor [Novosphingobium]|uniref:TonB-dependent receptor n=1 Tax=Novosphingobium TaxID=165696 RepID=UPI001CD2F104|nr:TonB-dependent receptor [Novosphingobium percolationis]MCH7628278.1 TonB-dependent receptor [Pseudomonadota bacterium]